VANGFTFTGDNFRWCVEFSLESSQWEAQEHLGGKGSLLDGIRIRVDQALP